MNFYKNIKIKYNRQPFSKILFVLKIRNNILIENKKLYY